MFCENVEWAMSTKGQLKVAEEVQTGLLKLTRTR